MALNQVQLGKHFEFAFAEINAKRIKAGRRPLTKKEAIDFIFRIAFDPEVKEDVWTKHYDPENLEFVQDFIRVQLEEKQFGQRR